MEIGKLKIFIIRKLYDHTYIGRRHTGVLNLQQGLPPHKRDMNIITKAVKELIKEGFLIPHKKGFRVSLNPKLLKEIKEIVLSKREV